MEEELKPGDDEIARKPCEWAKFILGEDVKCLECPFKRCIYDIFSDATDIALEETILIISQALKDYKK